MSGTSAGAKLAAQTNKKLYGSDFYQRIGAIGGRKSRGGGFKDRELAMRAGRLGGRASSRKGVRNKK